MLRSLPTSRIFSFDRSQLFSHFSYVFVLIKVYGKVGVIGRDIHLLVFDRFFVRDAGYCVMVVCRLIVNLRFVDWLNCRQRAPPV